MLDREALLHLMGKIWNAYGLRLDQAFRDAGVSLNAEQFRFLDLVRERPGQYQEIYSRALGRDRSSTTRMVQSLLRKGWITRIPAKELQDSQELDTRIKRIYLSEEGQKSWTLWPNRFVWPCFLCGRIWQEKKGKCLNYYSSVYTVISCN